MSRKTNKQKNLPKGGGCIKDKFKQIQQLKQMQAEMKKARSALAKEVVTVVSVSYTHLTLPTSDLV